MQSNMENPQEKYYIVLESTQDNVDAYWDDV